MAFAMQIRMRGALNCQPFLAFVVLSFLLVEARAGVCGGLFESAPSLVAQSADPDVRSFLERAENNNWVKRIDRERELVESGLAPEDLSLIREHSRDVWTMDEFLSRVDGFQPRFRLGLDDFHEAWSAIRQLVPSLLFNAYKTMEVDPKLPNHTELITSRMYNTGDVIVFFVPRAVLTHPGRNATANEMEWFLADRSGQRMKNVIFVFGAYNVMEDIGYWNLGLTFPDSTANYREKRAAAVAAIYRYLRKLGRSD